MSKFETLLEGLSLQIGIPKEQVCGEGQRTVNLIFDEKTGVEISNDAVNGKIRLSSKLFQVNDEEDMGAIALLLTQANFEQKGLYGAHLAMSEEGLIVLMRRVSLQSLNGTAFGDLIKEFVNAAAQWSDSVTLMSKLLKSDLNHTAGGESEVRMKV